MQYVRQASPNISVNRISHKAVPQLAAAAAGAGGMEVLKGVGGALGSLVSVGVEGAKLSWDVVTTLASGAVKTLVGVPLGIGLGGGFLVSKLTSPAESDLKVQEQQMVNARKKTMTLENLRKIDSDLSAWKANQQ
jgi:hypothetical protein